MKTKIDLSIESPDKPQEPMIFRRANLIKINRELQDDIKELEARGWVSVSDKPFPDRDGVLVCWDDEKLTAFYFSAEWTTMLPAGTVKWFLVPNPPEANT